MVNFIEAVKKATEYLKDTDVPVIITLQGRFLKDGFFVFNLESILKRENFLLNSQVIRLF